jgi:hypothetical protein
MTKVNTLTQTPTIIIDDKKMSLQYAAVSEFVGGMVECVRFQMVTYFF